MKPVNCFYYLTHRLATSRPLGERSEPFLGAKRPIGTLRLYIFRREAADRERRSRETSTFVPRHMKSDEGLF